MKKLILAFSLIFSHFSYAQNGEVILTEMIESCIAFGGECYVLQQYSPFLGQWNNMAIIYGFGYNDENCETIGSQLNLVSRSDVVERQYRCTRIR
jgi:hypothetical protein